MDIVNIILVIFAVVMIGLFIFIIIDDRKTFTDKKVKALQKLYEKGIKVYKENNGNIYYTLTKVRFYDDEDPDYDSLRLDKISIYVKDYTLTSRRNIIEVDLLKEIKMLKDEMKLLRLEIERLKRDNNQDKKEI